MAVGAPCCFTSQGKHLYHGVYYSKTQLPAWKWLPPVLNSPASLIDCIASFKLSMVHKLCSSEHNSAQCWPAATSMLRAPASSLFARAEIRFVHCAIRSSSLEKRQGETGVEKSLKCEKFLWVSVHLIQFCRCDIYSLLIWKPDIDKAARTMLIV